MKNLIDDQSPIAKYYQLKELLKDNINKGVWQPKSQIMSEPDICNAYGVSRVTVRKAMDELVREGYVYRVQGKGTFVREKIIEQSLNHFYSFRQSLRENGIEMTSRMNSFSIVPADTEIAAHLQISEEDQVFRLERLFLAEEVPYSKEVSYIPCEICRELTSAQIETFGLYNTMSRYGVFPIRASERIKAISLSREDANQMQMAEKDACIYLHRTTYSKKGIMEFNVSIVRGDTFVYSVELQNRLT